MTIPAYSELYVNDAEKCLAGAFDYAINTCNLAPDFFAKLFVTCGVAEQFERGNPTVISGKSGEELARAVLASAYPDETFPQPIYTAERSPEYWAGWALAQYQWESAKRFKDIFARVPLTEIISMYPTFHEMDITRFCESMDTRFDYVVTETKLKKIRESRGLSQTELAQTSGVAVRSIQLYEQRVNDIDKAQAQTLYKLSRTLGCTIEDLLESPEEQS